MFTLKQLIVLALAGVTVALPHDVKGSWPSRWGGNRDGKWVQTATASAETTVVTIYPDGNQSPKKGKKNNNDDDDDDSSSSSGSSGSSAPAASATPAASSGTSTGYMAIVEQYRSAAGLKALVQDSTLEANALACANAQKGDGSMKHILNGGSMAQVLAPGSASDFEHVYVGGWLCELPNMKGLNGVCATASKGWNHAGQTGHAEILSSTEYNRIGCALAKGIWACDLRFAKD